MINLKTLLLALITTVTLSAGTVTYEYSDNFQVQNWSVNNGDRNFTTPWADSQDNDPAAGRMQIRAESSSGANDGYLLLDKLNSDDNLTRRIDLSGALNFSWSFDYKVNLGSTSTTTEKLDIQFYNANTKSWDVGSVGVTLSDGNSTSPWLHAGPISNQKPPEFLTSNAGVRFTSGSGAWVASKDVKIKNLKFIVDYLDTDGDGVADKFDIDDDNDGILDVNESIVDLSVFQLQGSATEISATEYQITPASGNQYGSAMSKHTVSLLKDFTIDAEFYLGIKDSTGADGMAFVLHNDSRGSSAIGNGEGSTLGAMANGGTPGIANGLSFEFDTYKSSSGSDDPADDHTQIRDTDKRFNDTSGALTTVTALNNLEDGAWHTFHLDWDATTSTLSYLIDGSTMIGFTDSTIVADYFAGSSQVYFGFTAATGGKNNVQSIRNVSSTVLKDTDDDGIFNSLDLDSDNDGIPDNVEAQVFKPYLAPNNDAGSSNNGLDTAYTGGLTPIDTDGDGIPDYVDEDSDNDLVSDCNESYNISGGITKVICPVDNNSTGNTVGVNGLVEWADKSDDYVYVSGYIPNVVFQDEIIVDPTEPAYREAACGPAEVNLTAMQWKTVSFPCDLGTNDLEAILGGTNGLGTYGDNGNWVMYEQVDPDFTGNRNTMYLMVNGTDHIVAGKGYWIIADSTKTVRINRPLSGISQTATQPASGFSGIPTTGQAFEKVMGYQLPTSSDTDYRKVMLGNPFFKSYNLSDMYLSNGGGSYASLSSFTSGSGAIIEPIVFIKDSTDLTTGNYVAIDPGGTPGFGDRVPTMQGFWIKLNAGNSNTNTITFPFEK